MWNLILDYYLRLIEFSTDITQILISFAKYIKFTKKKKKFSENSNIIISIKKKLLIRHLTHYATENMLAEYNVSNDKQSFIQNMSEANILRIWGSIIFFFRMFRKLTFNLLLKMVFDTKII